MKAKLFFVLNPKGGSISTIISEGRKSITTDPGEIVHELALNQTTQNGLKIVDTLGTVYQDYDPFASLLDSVAQAAFNLGREQPLPLD